MGYHQRSERGFKLEDNDFVKCSIESSKYFLSAHVSKNVVL